METIRVVAEFLGYAAVIGPILWGALVFTRNKLIPFCQKVVKALESMEPIRKQVLPDGGHSLADIVQQIADDVCEMRASQDLMMVAMNQARFRCDANGNCVEVNRSYLDLVGAQREDALGREWVNLIHQSDQERVEREWDESVRHQRALAIDYKMRHKDGTVVNVRCKTRVVKRTDRVIGYIGIIEKAIIV